MALKENRILSKSVYRVPRVIKNITKKVKIEAKEEDGVKKIYKRYKNLNTQIINFVSGSVSFVVCDVDYSSRLPKIHLHNEANTFDLTKTSFWFGFSFSVGRSRTFSRMKQILVNADERDCWFQIIYICTIQSYK